MKIVLVNTRCNVKGNITYTSYVRHVVKITSKLVLLDDKIDHTSRFDKRKLGVVLFDNFNPINDHSTRTLQLKKVVLCEDNEVDRTIKQLKDDICQFALEELKKRREELLALELAYKRSNY